MRKVFLSLTALLLAVLASVALLPWALPGSDLVPAPAALRDGTLLTAENRLLTSRIYVQQNENVVDIYRESRLIRGQEGSIARVAADGANGYFARVSGDGTLWTLLRIVGNTAETVLEGTLPSGLNLTGLAVENGVAWFTAVDTDGAIHIYEGVNGELELIQQFTLQEGAVSAAYDGVRTRVTTTLGEHCYLAPSGSRTDDANAAEEPSPSIGAEGKAWILCKKTLLLAAAALWLVIAITILVTTLILRRAFRLSTRLAVLGGEILLLSFGAGLAGIFFLLVRVVGLQKAAETMIPASVAAGLLWLISLLALRLLSSRMTKPLRELTRQMDDIGEGRTSIREIAPGRDELHRMDVAIQQLCANLAIRDYEMEGLLRSYRRFVPHKLTEMLERANLGEVELGDSCHIQGNVGLFSVGNRADVRSALKDDAFVDFINYTFGLYQSCVIANQGSMISSGLRLSCMETLFPGTAADGIRAGLDFLGQTQKKPASHIPAPQSMVLFHRSPLLYGVAGQADHLYPYLSSAELEFLGSYSQRFYEIGVRMVVTEAYWSRLEGEGFTGRYIGFVSDGEKGAYKLYEILDAYSEMERKLRAGYDRRFQEAINLFYHNDFFMARNLFSTLLRACPEDGIARWYLFACEYFFNQEGSCEPDYQLFGVTEV